jgi:hypothetical protein
MTADTSTAELLGRIDDGWADLWARAEQLDDAQLARTGAGGWPVSVGLAHIGRWELWHRDAIQEHLRDGSRRSYAGFDGWNDAWAGEDRSLPAAEARRRMSESHEALRSLLAGLRPEQWTDAVRAWVQTCTFEHYAEHLPDLQV